MSQPPPPGFQASPPTSSSSTPQPHPSLPARPPPPAGAPPSLRQAASAHPRPAGGAPGTKGYGDNKSSAPGGFSGFTGFKPRSVNHSANSWNMGSTPAASYSAAPQSYSGSAQGSYEQHYYPQPSVDQYAHNTPPQIQNPFPLPGQSQGGAGRGAGGYDPEMEAQIAQWQSAYAAKDDGGRFGNKQNTTGVSANPVSYNSRAGNTGVDSTLASGVDKGVAAVVSGVDGKQKTVVRSGGGQNWQDPSLLEWDPAHPRLFIGNLAGEVTDDSLLKAFSRFPSVQKARVIRDKRTTKSKGYGFVSFSNGDDYFRAAKEMQGKYIGSHPVQIKRSTTEIKPTTPADKRKHGKFGKGGGGGGGKNGGNGNANTGAGVHKRPNKTKGGLRILG